MLPCLLCFLAAFLFLYSLSAFKVCRRKTGDGRLVVWWATQSQVVCGCGRPPAQFSYFAASWKKWLPFIPLVWSFCESLGSLLKILWCRPAGQPQKWEVDQSSWSLDKLLSCYTALDSLLFLQQKAMSVTTFLPTNKFGNVSMFSSTIIIFLNKKSEESFRKIRDRFKRTASRSMTWQIA